MPRVHEEKLPLLEDLRPTSSKYKSPSEKSQVILIRDANRYDQNCLNEDACYEKPVKPTCKSVLRNACACSPKSCILDTIPMLDWLPKYKWKRDILYDILSGITVSIMHIPQGMAYGLLGNVPPVVGLYMAFFPVIVYAILGTSRHVSMGTFAVVCLMTGKVIMEHGSYEVMSNGTMYLKENIPAGTPIYTNIEVATAVTFCVAMINFLMFILRLGVITNLLSDVFINGFTCACAFHVVGAQLKDLLGLHVPRRNGNFSLLYKIYDAAIRLPSANGSACLISFIVCLITIMNNEIFKPKLAKVTKIPFPIELLAVILGTTCSYLLDLHHNYNVTIVGALPKGLPEPKLPRFELIPDVLLDALLICIVSYAITISMGVILSQKSQKVAYRVDANQELLAQGCGNVVGSLFSCMPFTASLSRSVIQLNVGGVSQLASLVSCSILLVILLWIGPIFQFLPRCVLASIIIIALKSMLLQCMEVPKIFRLNFWDGMTWIVTFLVTTCISITYGMMLGVLALLFSLAIQYVKPYTCLLGRLRDKEIYLDINRYKEVEEVSGIKIIHYSGSVNFCTNKMFTRKVLKAVNFNKFFAPTSENLNKSVDEYDEEGKLIVKCVIIDLSGVSFIDPAGAEALRGVIKKLKGVGLECYLANCSGPVYESLMKADKYQKKVSFDNIFPSIGDAVFCAKAHLFATS